MSANELKSLSDDELLERLANVLKDSRRVEAELVAHIGEVDARRLYAREASSSMFRYATDVLHLSEAEAYLRITVARASRRHPVLLTVLEDGRLHLSGIAVLAPHLTEENRDELLARATHKTKAAIKELVAEIAPKPDVAPSIRKAPEGRRKPERDASKNDRPDTGNEAAPSSEGTTTASGPSRPEPPSSSAPETSKKKATVEPLSPARYHVQFTASAEFREKLDRLAALMPGADLASMLEQAVSEKLERLEAKRFGKTKKPRKGVDEADTSPGVRDIAAPVKRFVWARDGGQCTYVSREGRRCPERRGLQFHHDEPYGLGGDRSARNIRLLCPAHNLYFAEQDYGKEFMDRFRRSDRVREPAPSFQLCTYRTVVADGVPCMYDGR